MRQLQEFVEEFRRIGPKPFATKHASPVLVHRRHVDMAAKNFQTATQEDPNLVLRRHMPPLELVWEIAKGANSAYSNRVSVGRTKATDMVIDYAQMSKFHAYFSHETDGYYITDAESSNGTYLDGVRLPANVPHRLSEGSAILFGHHEFRFYSQSEFCTLIARMQGGR